MIFFYKPTALKFIILSGVPIVLPTAVHTVYRMWHTQVSCWSKITCCSLWHACCTWGHCHIESTLKNVFQACSTSWEHFSCAGISAPCVLCQQTVKEDASHLHLHNLLNHFVFSYIHWAGAACLSTSQPNTLPVWTYSCLASYWHTLML